MDIFTKTWLIQDRFRKFTNLDFQKMLNLMNLGSVRVVNGWIGVGTDNWRLSYFKSLISPILFSFWGLSRYLLENESSLPNPETLSKQYQCLQWPLELLHFNQVLPHYESCKLVYISLFFDIYSSDISFNLSEFETKIKSYCFPKGENDMEAIMPTLPKVEQMKAKL